VECLNNSVFEADHTVVKVSIFENDFIIFNFQQMWLERTFMTTLYSFPGILCWFPVNNTDTVIEKLRFYLILPKFSRLLQFVGLKNINSVCKHLVQDLTHFGVLFARKQTLNTRFDTCTLWQKTNI
jgi:hypothetical protein